MKTNLYVIYGGKSAEHDVSLKTAQTVINAVDKTKYDIHPIYISPQGVWSSYGRVERQIDHYELLRIKCTGGDVATGMGGLLIRYFASEQPCVAFPVIHGTNGEDGTLQGLLELLNVPYVGSGVLASAVAMDKAAAKRLLAEAGIPQAAYMTVLRHEWAEAPDAIVARIEEELGYPCYVKPANLGSSIGISHCADRPGLRDAVHAAFAYDRKLVVEREVLGRELQVAVLGNEHPVCSVAGEFEKEPEFFDYERKYMSGNLVQRIPAQGTDRVHEQLRDYALKAFQVLDGAGLMRVDFFVTDRDEVFLNEVNTMPGFTKISMFPALWERTDGTTYPQLIERLIGLALERHQHKQSIRYGREAL